MLWYTKCEAHRRTPTQSHMHIRETASELLRPDGWMTHCCTVIPIIATTKTTTPSSTSSPTQPTILVAITSNANYAICAYFISICIYLCLRKVDNSWQKGILHFSYQNHFTAKCPGVCCATRCLCRCYMVRTQKYAFRLIFSIYVCESLYIGVGLFSVALSFLFFGSSHFETIILYRHI